MDWKRRVGRPAYLTTEQRLGPQQRDALAYLRSLPDGVCPDTREIAAHIHKLVADPTVCQWAAKRHLGTTDQGDIERVHRMLTGALVREYQMENGRRAVEALQQVGLVVWNGDGWDLQERINARAKQGDVAAARAWLDKNYESLYNYDDDPERYRREMEERRVRLVSAATRGEEWARIVQHGLELLGGPDDAVLLAHLETREHLTKEERDLRARQQLLINQHNKALAAPEAEPTAPAEPQPAPPKPKPRGLAAITLAPQPDDPAVLREKKLYNLRLDVTNAEDDLDQLRKEDMPANAAKLAEATATLDSAKRALQEKQDQGKGTKRAKSAVQAAQAAFDEAEREVRLDHEEEARDETTLAAARKALRAFEAGVAAADAARAAGQNEDDAQAAGAVAHQAVLDGTEA